MRNRWRRRLRRSEKNEKTKEMLCQEDIEKKAPKGKISVTRCPSSLNNLKP
jgi:hypothetical protein